MEKEDLSDHAVFYIHFKDCFFCQIVAVTRIFGGDMTKRAKKWAGLGGNNV
jgi:hypothetical protein